MKVSQYYAKKLSKFWGNRSQIDSVSNFVHMVYYSHKKHDFSFYTNIDANEN